MTLGDFGDFIAGAGDAVFVGLSHLIRKHLPGGDPRNLCSSYYRAGAKAALVIGGARLTYAGLAKGLPLAYDTAEEVFAARNVLKQTFRLDTFPNSRVYTWEQITTKYGGDSAKIIAAATRTNPMVNAAGAASVVGSVVNLGAGGCHE